MRQLVLADGNATDRETPNVVIDSLGDRLIVRHRRDTQRRIRKLLRNLDALAPAESTPALMGGMGGMF
jgi:hypothetical protein